MLPGNAWYLKLHCPGSVSRRLLAAPGKHRHKGDVLEFAPGALLYWPAGTQMARRGEIVYGLAALRGVPAKAELAYSGWLVRKLLLPQLQSQGQKGLQH